MRNATKVLVASSIAVGLASASFVARPLAVSLRAAQGAHEAQSGERVFERETFGGNGRTCSTCHRPEDSFSTTPASARARFAADPADPLFRQPDSDDGAGRTYTRLLAHATVRVRISLKCRNIWLEDEPTATSVVVNRGIPGLLDTPALDPILMSDGRAPSLEQQALEAIHDHVDPRVEPSPDTLRLLAAYEISDRFFSSDVLRRLPRRGMEPDLPPGITEEEKRGRVHFLPTGACGRCHAGPMLNTTSSTSVLGAGRRFANTRTGEMVENQRINPFVKWHVINNDGSERVFNDFSDPGRILITCRREDLTNFKIRSLWNVKNTAPYFHDNSAKTLDDVIAHYREYLKFRNVSVSDEDLADILAYLKLL